MQPTTPGLVPERTVAAALPRGPEPEPEPAQSGPAPSAPAPSTAAPPTEEATVPPTAVATAPPAPAAPAPADDASETDAPGRVEFVHRSWPADPAQLSVIRRELSGWLAPLNLTDDETADVVLAVDEAAANAVRHAYGPGRSGVVELTLWTEPGTLCVEVVDHGSWRPPAAPAPVGDAADGGRGISLMSTMADAVLIHYDARGSRVLLRRRVTGADPVDEAGQVADDGDEGDDLHVPSGPVTG